MNPVAQANRRIYGPKPRKRERPKLRFPAPVAPIAPDARRYWRILCISLGGGRIREIEMRDRSGSSDVTSDTYAIAGAAALPAANAFSNGSADWAYGSGTAADLKWVGQDFGAGNEKDIVDITIRSGTLGSDTPVDFKVQYSDDGTTWTDSWTIATTAWGSDETRGFTRPA